MKQLNTLIRLKKREVDALKQQMGALTEQRNILEQLQVSLEDELRNEVETAGDLVSLGVFFADYSESNKQKKEAVQKKIDKIDQQMNALSDKMMAIYGEQKKYEVALERKQAQRRYEHRRQEQQFLDEQATIRHTREAH